VEVWILGIEKKEVLNGGEQKNLRTLRCFLLTRDADYFTCGLMDSGCVGRELSRRHTPRTSEKSDLTTLALETRLNKIRKLPIAKPYYAPLSFDKVTLYISLYFCCVACEALLDIKMSENWMEAALGYFLYELGQDIRKFKTTVHGL
jgi:hypothetical protein